MSGETKSPSSRVNCIEFRPRIFGVKHLAQGL